MVRVFYPLLYDGHSPARVQIIISLSSRTRSLVSVVQPNVVVISIRLFLTFIFAFRYQFAVVISSPAPQFVHVLFISLSVHNTSRHRIVQYIFLE